MRVRVWEDEAGKTPPQAFVGMLEGRNVGKLVVRVAG
jgi:NADPH-dependent curcumin reductase CurA